MRTKRLLASVGILAAVALAPSAWAADVPSTGAGGSPPSSGTLRTYAEPKTRVPLSPTRRMTDRVQQLSQQIQRDIGAIYPGEDTLGAGTSITH